MARGNPIWKATWGTLKATIMVEGKKNRAVATVTELETKIRANIKKNK